MIYPATFYLAVVGIYSPTLSSAVEEQNGGGTVARETLRTSVFVNGLSSCRRFRFVLTLTQNETQVLVCASFRGAKHCMATLDDLKSFARLRSTGGVLATNVPKLPPLPKDVRDRFPSLAKWEKEVEEKFRVPLSITITGGTGH